MDRKSVDSAQQAKNSFVDTNKNETLQLCSKCPSEGKCIADKIEATIHNDKDNLYSENTRENEVSEEADEVETIDLYLNNALKLSNEAKTGNSVLKLFSQTNQESDAYECTVNSIPAKDTQMKSVSHIQENICTKYSKNILQNTQKTESIMDNNETKIKENNELKLPIQNKQETINENQLETTVNKYKEIKLSLQNTQDNVFYANKIEANNNSEFLLQEKNKQNIDGRTSDDKKLNENLINNGTTDPTTIFNKNLIDLQSINKSNQEIKVKIAINEDKELKIPLQSTQENVCDANKIETYKNSELLLQDKHVENTDEKLITNKNKKLEENFIDNTHSTADSATIKNKYLKDLLNTQKSRNEHKEKTMINVDKELKLPFKNTQERIRDESKIEISKTSPLLLQTKQKNETKVDKEKTMTNEDTKLQLFSKDKQEIISEKDMKKITINNGNNISKTFYNIKQSIKQFKKLKFKNYLKKRKEKKAAVTLEKEKLKNISETAQKTQNEYKYSEEVEWFKNQYERYIGMPKTKETNPAYVLGYLRMKAYCRYVPEAKGQCFFKSVSKEPSDSVFLSWNGPRLPKCTCPYKECFCRGDMILESEKIPSGRYNWDPMIYYLQWLCCFRMFLPQPCTKDLIKKLTTITNAEEERYQNLSKKGLLSQIAPELCLMRCQHYKKQGDKRTIKYLLIDFKEQNPFHENEREDITQNTDPIEEEKDDRVCNNYSCTVSSQTDTGPDGELIVGKVTQFIFPSIKHSVLSDVEGKKLKISPYEREYKEPDNNYQINIRKIENLFNIKEIKSRLSRLISSIIEIKDQGIPVNTRTTQFPSCGKICEDITRDKRSDTSRFETPWLKKVGNFMEHVNKDNKVDDPSSCTCCKLYKESLNIKAGDN